MGIAFNSCSDNDDDQGENNLSSIITGVWMIDGDDIFVINKDGTGVSYCNQSDYHNSDIEGRFTWKVKDDCLYIIDVEDTTDMSKLIALHISKDEILWEWHAGDDNGAFENECFISTWTRYE